MKLLGLSSSASENALRINRAYMTAFTRPGVVPVMLPLLPTFDRETLTQDEYNAFHKPHLDTLVERLDGYVATGGPDLNPVLFDQPIWGASACDAERDMMELATIGAFITAGKPVLGICKGHQLAGLFFGFTNFLQDLSETHEVHSTSDREMKDRMEPAHMTHTFGEFRDHLREVTGRADLTSIKTNSHHHQGFCFTPNGLISKADMKNIGLWFTNARQMYEEVNGINVLASTTRVIEAVEKEDAKYVGFQWHVEEAGPKGPSIDYWIKKYLTD